VWLVRDSVVPLYRRPSAHARMRDMNKSDLLWAVAVLIASVTSSVLSYKDGYKAGLRHAQEMAPAHPSPALKGN
jgi:hypothetical protein